LYGTSVSRLTNACAVIGLEKRMAKNSLRPGAQPRVSRIPVSVPSARSRNDDQRILPGYA